MDRNWHGSHYKLPGRSVNVKIKLVYHSTTQICMLVTVSLGFGIGKTVLKKVVQKNPISTLKFSSQLVLRDRPQIFPLILIEFKQINKLLYPLKISMVKSVLAINGFLMVF